MQIDQKNNPFLERLKKAGLRVTPARKAIIQSLAASHSALSVKALALKANVDQATAYRNLTPLLACGVIEAITLPQHDTRYALRHHHHDHLICTECGTIVPITCTKPSHPTHDTFATITHHEVTFYGVCKHCSHS